MPDLQTALHAHQQAVQAFLASARAVPPERWNEPRAEGKWSPGQIAEHVALSYDASGEVLHGRAPGPVPPRLLRPLLRTVLLRPVLWLGRFPAASKAPGILQPGSSVAAAPVLLDRLQSAAASFESATRRSAASLWPTSCGYRRSTRSTITCRCRPTPRSSSASNRGRHGRGRCE